jgi:hypothetical protein
MIKKIFLPCAAASWSKDELHRLRLLAQAGASADTIARALNRSASAIRNKASMHGISLSAGDQKRARVTAGKNRTKERGVPESGRLHRQL